MRMNKIALLAALALAGVPAGALAAKPSHPATPANTTHASTTANPTSSTDKSSSAAKPKTVTFVLHGTLTAFTAYNATTKTNGSVTINVTSSNFGSKVKGSMSFTVDSKTKVVGTFTANDRGVVKVRAAKGSTSLSGAATEVIDQGDSH